MSFYKIEREHANFPTNYHFQLSVHVHLQSFHNIQLYSLPYFRSLLVTLIELINQTQSALGMEPNQPPPYLVNMQRYGAPPSYPNLKIPGLNAPLPEGASWGFQPGGWGKEPTDLVYFFFFLSTFLTFLFVLTLLMLCLPFKIIS